MYISLKDDSLYQTKKIDIDHENNYIEFKTHNASYNIPLEHVKEIIDN